MNRISRIELGIAIADLISSRSTCKRNQVGCVITSVDHRLISSGYNGPLSEVDCELSCDINEPCQNAIHAEANAIAAAAKWGTALMGSIMYCTVSPCIKCAELIVQAGIFKVIYKDEYRDNSGIKLLIRRGISLQKYEGETTL